MTPSRGGDQPESLRADALSIPSVGDLVADIPCLIVALGRVPRRHRISDEGACHSLVIKIHFTWFRCFYLREGTPEIAGACRYADKF